ncbi:MAG: DUF4365 domain-containing protein, partial [Verrucomicrobia bacterium]|nr:DUF4365 domain-containing protein [Verrucomicrobiota bacterium]
SLNVEPLRINKNDLKFITQEFHRRIQKSRLTPGDVVIVRTGKPGACSVVPDWLTDANCSDLVIVRCGKQLNNRFLAYYVNTVASGHVAAHLVGAVQQHFNVGSARTLRLSLPPLTEQKAIAAVLGALDDKIELNRRMNATLEAMARALFQSWFVDFDPVRAKLDGRPPAALDTSTAALFPEHLEDSPLGHIPKGWTAKRLPDAIEVNPRRTLKGGTIAPYLDMKNLPTQGHSAEEVIDREFSSGTKFQNGDTLLARITPCLENGKTGYVDFLEDGQVGWGSTEYIILSPKPPLPPQFGYLLARSDALRTHAIQNMTGTSGRQRVPSECFNTFWLAVPPPDIARRFDELTAPLMAKIKAAEAAERGTLNHFPKSMNTKEINRESGRYFSSLLLPNWAERSQEDQEDYGVDCEIELMAPEDKATGFIFKVQLKGTAAAKYDKSGQLVYSDASVERFKYYISELRIPLVFVVCDVKTGDCFWARVQGNRPLEADLNAAAAKKQETFTIKFPPARKLLKNEESSGQIVEAVESALDTITLRGLQSISPASVRDHIGHDIEAAEKQFRLFAGIAATESIRKMVQKLSLGLLHGCFELPAKKPVRRG